MAVLTWGDKDDGAITELEVVDDHGHLVPVGRFGSVGFCSGQFRGLSAACISTAGGELYVSDLANHVVQVFTRRREAVFSRLV